MSTATTPITRTAIRVYVHEKLLVVAICVVYFIIAIHSALLRPLWFDELSTLFVAARPTLREVFRAIPLDGNPPLYFLLARLFLHLHIKTELAMRFPSVIGYPLTAVSIYWFVRRNTVPIFAFLSMTVFLACIVSLRFAVEARSYTLMMTATGFVLCCWQSRCRTGSRWAVAGVALGICCAILLHQYGVITVGLPLLVGEAVRTMRLRRIDVPLLAAGIICALPLVFTIPPTLSAQKPLLDAIRIDPTFVGHPQLTDLKYYEWMLPPLSLLLMVVAAVVAVPIFALAQSRLPRGLHSDSTSEDLAVASTLALLLPVMLAVIHFGTGYFQPRYGVGSAIGISILCGLALSQLQARWRHAASFALVGTTYSLIVGAAAIWMAHTLIWNVIPWKDPLLRAADTSDDPIVVASALEFPPMWWYSDSVQRARLHYLSDPPYAGQQTSPIPEDALWIERSITPMQMEDYQTFLGKHRHFYLYCYGEPINEFVVPRLEREGWHLTTLASEIQPLRGYQKKQEYRQLFEVSR